MEKATVYFTNELTPEAVVKMYRQLGIDLPGKVASRSTAVRTATRTTCAPSL